jgi:hypothetical protein
VDFVRERTMPTEQPPLVGEVVPTFADGGCCAVTATDSHWNLLASVGRVARKEIGDCET